MEQMWVGRRLTRGRRIFYCWSPSLLWKFNIDCIADWWLYVCDPCGGIEPWLGVIQRGTGRTGHFPLCTKFVCLWEPSLYYRMTKREDSGRPRNTLRMRRGILIRLLHYASVTGMFASQCIALGMEGQSTNGIIALLLRNRENGELIILSTWCSKLTSRYVSLPAR